MRHIMNHFIQPKLKTERLMLRPIERTDADDVFDYARNELVGPSAGWKPHTSVSESREFIDYSIKKKAHGQPGVYAILEKNSDKVIGTIEVHSVHQTRGEIGFVLHPDYWNKGYVTEAAKAIIIYAFEILKLKRLAYCHFPDNLASKRVCEKCEFTFEGILRKKFHRYDGTVLDDVVYSIIDDDYHNNKLSWLNELNRPKAVDSEGKAMYNQQCKPMQKKSK